MKHFFSKQLNILVVLMLPVLALPACSSGPVVGDAASGEALMVAKQNDCTSCHQSSKASDGVMAGGSSPAPNTMIYGPNLTPDKDTGLGTWSDAQITRAIVTGVDDEGATLCVTMPRFSTFSDQDVADVVAYLRSIPAVKNQVPEGACK